MVRVGCVAKSRVLGAVHIWRHQFWVVLWYSLVIICHFLATSGDDIIYEQPLREMNEKWCCLGIAQITVRPNKINSIIFWGGFPHHYHHHHSSPLSVHLLEASWNVECQSNFKRTPSSISSRFRCLCFSDAHVACFVSIAHILWLSRSIS